MAKFDLSKKKIKMYSGIRFKEFVYPEAKVKEFIKLELNLFRDYANNKISWMEFMKKRKELAGKELSNG